MIFIGATALVIAGTYLMIYIWQRGDEYGVSIPDAGISHDSAAFLGADSIKRAVNDAVDIGEAASGVEITQTTAWRRT